MPIFIAIIVCIIVMIYIYYPILSKNISGIKLKQLPKQIINKKIKINISKALEKEKNVKIKENKGLLRFYSSYPLRFIFSICIIVLFFSTLFYLFSGSPFTSSMTYKQQVQLAEKEIQKLSKIEELLLEKIKENASDYVLLEQLGRIYNKKQDYKNAKKYFEKSIEKGNKSSSVYSNLAKSLTLLNNGKIPTKAKRLFLKSLRINKKNNQAKYYLGLSRMQNEDYKGAIGVWKYIKANSEKSSSINKIVTSRIIELEELTGLKANNVPLVDPAVFANGFILK